MTDEQSNSVAALTRLNRPVRLTRAGMVAERGVRAFWPLWSIVFVVVAALAFGAGAILSPLAVWITGGLIAVALGLALLRGLRRFRMPSRDEALARLDASLPGRPITALLDQPAVGAGDAESEAVWQAHIARMAARAATARAPAPDLRVSDQDPYALRLLAATALIAALLFGSLWRVGDIGSLAVGPGEAAISGPSWEGWVEPPLYTGLPSLYLNDIDQESFAVPVGSRITIRFYGEAGALSFRQTVAPGPTGDSADPTASAHDLVLARAGVIAIEGPGGQSWEIAIIADQAPAVSFEGPLSGVPPGQMQLPFGATDDYGVIAGRALVRLDPSAVDRRYGLVVEPEPREPLVLDLPMPFSGSRADFLELLVEDLSEHPFANLPVLVTLEVTDHSGQIGTATESFARLPGRRFFDPVANALVEMRRDLLWSRENAARVTQILRAVSYEPQGVFENEEAYRIVRRVIARLDASIDTVSVETQEEVAQLLWDAALMIEEGDLSGALERLRRAQERLAEAMRQGASDEEIAQLMDELRQAMDDYLRELAQDAQPPGTDELNSGEQTEMSMADLEEMLRRIEELMQEGRMAEAMQMLEALRQMMENMQVTQGEGGDGPRSPGQEAMDGLRDTLRDQQSLSDENFRQLQEQFNSGRQNGQGQAQGGEQAGQPEGEAQGDGQGGENGGMSLAERQEALRRQLEEQAQRLPAQGTDGGEAAQDRLDQAGRAMDEAAEALGRGDLADALDSQSEAMEALREGMAELGRALAQDQTGEEPGQGQADGNMAPDRPLQDPLGRQAGNSGAFGSDESFEQREEAFRRARELLDELRGRVAEQDRPDLEREYLRRLLERF